MESENLGIAQEKIAMLINATTEQFINEKNLQSHSQALPKSEINPAHEKDSA